MIKAYIYLRNKETQQKHIVRKQYDARFSANDIYSWKQYVCVKLQQVQRNYRLRNHAGMCLTSLTPVVNCWNIVNKIKIGFKNSWIRLRIMEMISWQPSCNFLKRLNVINVNSANCVKREKIIFWLSFIVW